ncbi:MAG TPA: tetratricopeptide repeat protein, partial [Planctomycetota bacterium]|nr:tetratricopeptide repeat protein [Planctomycetota bacterium]
MGKRVRSILSLLVLAVLAVAAGVYIRFYLQDAGRMPMPPEFEDRLRQGNGAVEGLRTLAEARAMLKDAPDEAAQRLRALIAAAPSSPEAFEARLILAELLAKGGDAPGAIRLLDDVIAGQAGPRRTRAHIERAKILGKTDPAAARRDLQEVLGNDEHLPALQLKARLELGLLDLEAGDYLRAIATLSPLTARDYP